MPRPIFFATWDKNIKQNDMETKEIKIKVPEGYDIDKENSTFDCIKLKPIQSRFSDYDGTKKIFGFGIGGGSAIIEIKEVDKIGRAHV